MCVLPSEVISSPYSCGDFQKSFEYFSREKEKNRCDTMIVGIGQLVMKFNFCSDLFLFPGKNKIPAKKSTV